MRRVHLNLENLLYQFIIKFKQLNAAQVHEMVKMKIIVFCRKLAILVLFLSYKSSKTIVCSLFQVIVRAA